MLPNRDREGVGAFSFAAIGKTSAWRCPTLTHHRQLHIRRILPRTVHPLLRLLIVRFHFETQNVGTFVYEPLILNQPRRPTGRTSIKRFDGPMPVGYRMRRIRRVTVEAVWSILGVWLIKRYPTRILEINFLPFHALARRPRVVAFPFVGPGLKRQCLRQVEGALVL